MNKLFVIVLFSTLFVLSSHAQEPDQKLITLWLEACDNLKKTHSFTVQGSYNNYFERSMAHDYILDTDLSIHEDTYTILVDLTAGEPTAFVFTLKSASTDGPNKSYLISEYILIEEQLYMRSQSERVPFDELDDSVSWNVRPIAIFGYIIETLEFYTGLDTTIRGIFSPSLFCFPESSVVNVHELPMVIIHGEPMRIVEVTIDRGKWLFEKDKPSYMPPFNDYEMAVIEATQITQQIWISEDGLPYRVETWLSTDLNADRLLYYNDELVTDVSLQHQLHTLLEYSDFNVPFEITPPTNLAR